MVVGSCLEVVRIEKGLWKGLDIFFFEKGIEDRFEDRGGYCYCFWRFNFFFFFGWN